MAEILLMKTIKFLLSFMCYSGTSLFYIDQELEGKIVEAMNISHDERKILIWLFIFFWIIKIVWFIIDKYIELKERFRNMKK